MTFRYLKQKMSSRDRPLGPGQPGGLTVGGLDRETAIVVGEVAMEHLFGLGGGAGVGQPEFAGEPVLKGPPQSFHPALGLGRAGKDQLDAELLEEPAELGRLASTSERLFKRELLVFGLEE